MQRVSWGALSLLMFIVPGSGLANVITFEGLAESASVNTSYAGQGVIFLNATILTAGGSLNTSEFPPRSGVNVAFDDSGPVFIVFNTPQLSVGAYLTYTFPVTLTAYDALFNPLGSVSSLYFSNTASTGDPGSLPNEFLGFNAPSASIAAVAFEGGAGGSTYTLDDLTFNTSASTVPEPGSVGLLALGLAVVILGGHKRFRRSSGLVCVLLAVPSFIQAQAISNASASPSIIPLNQSTLVTVTAKVNVAAGQPDVVLQRMAGLTSGGRTVLGTMQSTGGGIYTIQVPLLGGVSPTTIQLIVVATVPGVAQPYTSQPFQVFTGSRLIPPSGFTGGFTLNVGAELFWSSNDPAATMVQVERATENADFVTLAKVAPSAKYYRDATIQLGTRYHYRLRSMSATAQSDPTAPLDVLAPVNVTAPPDAPTGVTLNISPTTGAVLHFDIAYPVDPVAYTVLVDSQIDSGNFRPSGMCRIPAPGPQTCLLTNIPFGGTRLAVRLRALTAGGLSSYSATAAGTLPPPGPGTGANAFVFGAHAPTVSTGAVGVRFYANNRNFVRRIALERRFSDSTSWTEASSVSISAAELVRFRDFDGMPLSPNTPEQIGIQGLALFSDTLPVPIGAMRSNGSPAYYEYRATVELVDGTQIMTGVTNTISFPNATPVTSSLSIDPATVTAATFTSQWAPVSCLSQNVFIGIKANSALFLDGPVLSDTAYDAGAVGACQAGGVGTPIGVSNTVSFRTKKKTGVFLVHGIDQGHEEMAGLAAALRNPASGLDPLEYMVDGDFDYSECAKVVLCGSGCTIESGAAKLAAHIAATSVGDKVLVGYSMGGLIARQAIVFGVETKRLVTLGSPNLGYAYRAGDALAKCSTLAVEMSNSGDPDTPSFAQSLFLDGLNRQWSFLRNRPYWTAIAGTACGDPYRIVVPQLSISLFGGALPVKACSTILGSSRNDGVVCHDSALFQHPSLEHPDVVAEDSLASHSWGTIMCPFASRRYLLFLPPPGSTAYNKLLAGIKGQ